MKIECFFTAKTGESYLKEGIAIYCKRLTRYCQLSVHTIETPTAWGKLSPPIIAQREGQLMLKLLEGHPNVWLLDEKGTEFTSPQLAKMLDKLAIQGDSRIAFVIGGAYGFGDQVRSAFPQTLSLSKLTFSHQMVRLIFLEQLYRAFTIIRGEPYHHA